MVPENQREYDMDMGLVRRVELMVAEIKGLGNE